MSNMISLQDAQQALDQAQMHSYPAYPEYKASDIEWLGDVPVHWVLKSIKRDSPVCRGASPRPINDQKYFDDSGEYAWVRIADVTASNTYLLKTTQRLSELGASLSVKMQPGDIFLSIAGSVGKPCITKIKCCIHDGFVYFPKLSCDRKFLYYVFASGEPYQGLGKLGTQLNLNTDTVGSIVLAYPSLPEQRTIVNFLDEQTKKIDDLIAAKERLLTLLTEKRQALITHAVTKGLNPNAPLKPSGIDWLGDVPEHWEIASFRYYLKSKAGSIKTGPFGSHLTSADMNGDFAKVYNQRTVLDNDFNSGDNYISEDKYLQLKSFEVFGGDLMITTRGTIGRCAIAPDNVQTGILHPCLMRMQMDSSKVLKQYMELLIQDTTLLTDQLRIMSNATTIDVIYSESLKRTMVVVPPLKEQSEILDFIRYQTSKLDELVQKATKAIDLLKEYRTALISEAVTGKIDVRNWKSSKQSVEQLAGAAS